MERGSSNEMIISFWNVRATNVCPVPEDRTRAPGKEKINSNDDPLNLVVCTLRTEYGYIQSREREKVWSSPGRPRSGREVFNVITDESTGVHRRSDGLELVCGDVVV